MITFLIVSGTILITSLLTATMIVGGIEYILNKIKEDKSDGEN